MFRNPKPHYRLSFKALVAAVFSATLIPSCNGPITGTAAAGPVAMRLAQRSFNAGQLYATAVTRETIALSPASLNFVAPQLTPSRIGLYSDAAIILGGTQLAGLRRLLTEQRAPLNANIAAYPNLGALLAKWGDKPQPLTVHSPAALAASIRAFRQSLLALGMHPTALSLTDPIAGCAPSAPYCDPDADQTRNVFDPHVIDVVRGDTDHTCDNNEQIECMRNVQEDVNSGDKDQTPANQTQQCVQSALLLGTLLPSASDGSCAGGFNVNCETQTNFWVRMCNLADDAMNAGAAITTP